MQNPESWNKTLEQKNRYMGEGAEQAQRIDCLLEEGRNAETILQHTKKQVAGFYGKGNVHKEFKTRLQKAGQS